MKEKMQHCFNCGAELGIYRHYPGDIEVCGAAECLREMRAQQRMEDEQAQDAAREDNYGRYR